MPEPATSDPTGRVAVLVVRDGALPSGAHDTVRAAGGDVVVVGHGASSAAVELVGAPAAVRAWDTPGFAPGAWAVALAPLLERYRVVVLPASPDGRDLAPRVAAELGRSVLAGAVSIRSGPGGESISTAALGGSVLAEHSAAEPVVVTFQSGVGHAAPAVGAGPEIDTIELVLDDDVADATVVELLPPDVATMDLAEAHRILGGGAGLDSADRFEQLTAVATSLGASMGATRVITDRAWVPHSRQIGTTGVVVAPELYLAFGISGAVQHTAGLGDPSHVISVNTDPHCPMMNLADLAVVADANDTLDQLALRLDQMSETGAADE